MSQESKKMEPSVSDPDLKSNLLSIQDSGKEKQVMEINRQMTSLEGSISKLNTQLNASNKQIRSDVERLSKSDAEITEKVADTYKQLGLIEGTFSDLSTQSKQINVDLKKVNSSLKAFEKSSTLALNEAIDNQSAVNNEFRQQHEDLILRAETLSKKASTMATKLTKSIKQNSLALTELEARIISELENVAQSSQQRDDKLGNKIKSSSEEISSQKARMMLMQSVDEALEKRTAALEATSAHLIEDSENLKTSTEILDVLTSKLSADIEALEMHTASLAQQNIEQQGFIEALQEKAGSITRTLLAMATLEKKHFRVLLATSLMLFLAIIASFFYSEYMRETEQLVEVQRNSVINEQVAQLSSRVEDEQMASQVFYSEILELQSNLNQVQSELQQKTALIEVDLQKKAEQIQQMNDEVESLDGRVRYLAPLYNFGSDNTIYGSQWLSKLDPAKLSIKIATVKDKQSMYEIAQRYNRHFTEELAYFVTADEQYSLIYGGKFDDAQQISDKLRKMPGYINFQSPVAIANADILAQIKQ